MRFAFFITAVALAACAAEPPKAPTPTPEPAVPQTSDRLPAPEIAGATIRVTADDKGKTIEAPVGATVSIALVGVPTAGYLWKPAKVPAFLEPAGDTGGPTSQDQKKPGFTGGSHWEVTGFKVKAAGAGDIVMEQRRPWETNEPASDTFTVTIVAK
jgi:inhibitor of cysteine peptidase